MPATREAREALTKVLCPMCSDNFEDPTKPSRYEPMEIGTVCGLCGGRKSPKYPGMVFPLVAKIFVYWHSKRGSGEYSFTFPQGKE